MRKLRFLAFFLCSICLALSSRAQTATVVFAFSNFVSQPINVSRAVITPDLPGPTRYPSFLSSYLPPYTRGNTPSLTNGLLTITNLILGYSYNLDFSDGYQTTHDQFYIETNYAGTTVFAVNFRSRNGSSNNAAPYLPMYANVIISNITYALTINAATNFIGTNTSTVLFASPVVFIPTNFDVAGSSAAERNALIASNALALSALSATNTAVLTTATNLSAAERAALIASNSLAIAEIIATNTANLTITTNLAGTAQTNAMVVATNAAAIERAALIASNVLALAALSATNTAILGTATNLSATERAALIASNNLANAALIATNTAILTTATNLSAAERAALIATNTANLQITTNLVTFAQTNATATNLAPSALNQVTNIASSVSGIGNFISSSNGLGTNNILTSPGIKYGQYALLTNGYLAVGGSFYVLNGLESYPVGNTFIVPNSDTWKITGPQSGGYTGIAIGRGLAGPLYENGSFVAGVSNDVAAVLSKNISGGTIVGGAFNVINTNGDYATVVGGENNYVNGSFSWAAGKNASNNFSGTWIWADPENSLFGSTAANQFLVRASGGVGINTNDPGTNSLRALGNIDASGFSISGTPIVQIANVVQQSGGATNITAQQSFSLGGGPTFSMSTNVIGISNSIAKGTYQLIAPGVWTNLIQTGWSLNISAGTIYVESNLGAVFSLMTNTFNTTNWSIVAAPGAVPTPVSYIGSLMQGDGMVVTGYFPTSTNLNFIITNQAAIAAARVSPFPTNGFNSLTITNTRSAGFIVTNPASATALVVLTNGDMLANNVVSGANRVILNSTDLATHGIELFINSGASGQYLYMNENGLDVSSTNELGSFMQFHPNFFLTQVKPLDGKTSVFQVNESDEISGINGVGAGFNVLSTGDVTLFSSNVNFLTISPDGNNYFSGATNIMTGTLTATNDGDLFGSSLYVGRNTAQQVMTIQPAPGAVTNFWQVNGTNAAAVAYVDTNNVLHANGIQPTNVNLTAWGKYSTNSFVNSTNGASTNTIIYNGTGWTFLNAQAGIVQWKTQLVGAVSEVDVIGGNLQDGQGVITLGWLARTFRDNLGGLVATWTNGFKIISGDIGGATNLAYNGLDLPARQGITNLVNSVFNTSLTPANVNTNLLIAGVSQEGLWTNAIVLRGSSNSVNLVYTKQSDSTWTNTGSGFGIVFVSGILRFNNIDNGGNILFFKTNSPQGLWSVNFVATNPPTGDWGRISDFGAGGISEGWVITNLPVSAIAGAPPTSPVILSSNRFVFQSGPYTNGYLISPTLTNATIVNGVVAPTNILVPTNYFFQNALSLVLGCSNSIFSKNLSAANYIHPGNDLVFSGQGQFKIIGVLNATQALAVNYISGNANSFTQQPTAYYPSFDFLDINSAGSGGIGNGGEYMGEGNFGTAETGVNSGQASTMWALCGTNSVLWGIAADKSYNLYRVLANSQTPDVIHVDVQNGNNYEDIRIRANGDVGMRGLTNTPGSGLGYLPVRGMFYSASNAAPITTFPAAIALGTGFSNTNTTRAQWHGQFILTDAVGGQPILVVSNFTANWVMTNSFPQGLGAAAPLSIVTPIVSPSDSLGIYDNSTGSGASVTFVKGWWERQ